MIALSINPWILLPKISPNLNSNDQVFNPNFSIQKKRQRQSRCLFPSLLASKPLEDGFIIVEDDIQALIKVVLDLGRQPEARFLGESCGQYLRNTEISLEELEEVHNAVGEFGRDNRAGIEGTLPRISAIRSRTGLIVGLTCRVGRAITGHVEMIRDLQQYKESILFLRRPGVGKTTVMREIARVLADELHKRMVIVALATRLEGMWMSLIQQ